MMTPEELRAALFNQITVPVWPHAGMALGLSRNSTYEAVQRGEIPSIKIGGAIRIPTGPLRKLLGLEKVEAAAGKAA